MFKKNIINTAVLAAVIAFIIAFIRKAYKAGRLYELAISSILLGEAYYLLLTYFHPLIAWHLLVPIGVYALYWCYLFSHEKIESPQANKNWADRNWWWKLDGWEFEEEVARVFRLNGYRAKVTKKTSDGGIDIIMYKGNKKIIAQCKHYGDPVSVSVARELNGLKEDFNADELMLIASSGVTKSAKEFVENKPYFKILNLEDVIGLGLRPAQQS